MKTKTTCKLAFPFRHSSTDSLLMITANTYRSALKILRSLVPSSNDWFCLDKEGENINTKII